MLIYCTAIAAYFRNIHVAKLIIFPKSNTLLTMFLKSHPVFADRRQNRGYSNFSALSNLCVAPLLPATYFPAASPAFFRAAASDVKVSIVRSKPA